MDIRDFLKIPWFTKLWLKETWLESYMVKSEHINAASLIYFIKKKWIL